MCHLDQNIQSDTVFIPTAQNTFDVATSNRSEIPRAKKAIKQSIQEQTLELWNSKVERLTMQGDFAKLLIEEKENVTWISIINNVPRGILSFALNSITNSLPTPDNLRRWGKRVVSKCPLFSNHGGWYPSAPCVPIMEGGIQVPPVFQSWNIGTHFELLFHLPQPGEIYMEP